MNKVYRLHDHKDRFLFELATLENCRKNAEALYGTVELGIDDATYTREYGYSVKVTVIKDLTLN